MAGWLDSWDEGKERCTADSSSASASSSLSLGNNVACCKNPVGCAQHAAAQAAIDISNSTHAVQLFQPQSDDHRPVWSEKAMVLWN